MSWVLRLRRSTIIRHNILLELIRRGSIAMRNLRKMRNLPAGSQ